SEPPRGEGRGEQERPAQLPGTWYLRRAAPRRVEQREPLAAGAQRRPRVSDEELALGQGHKHLADSLRRSFVPEVDAGTTECPERGEGGSRPDDARRREGRRGRVPELLVETARLDELLAAVGIDHAGHEAPTDARQVSEAHE